MSEEEIIKMLKEYSATNPFQKNIFYVSNLHEAIQGLLDLYNKEKEKNKVIEIYRKDMPKDTKLIIMQKEDFDRNFSSEYIAKDKIKEVIEEQYGTLCMELGSYERDNATSEQERIAGGINELRKLKKELL